MKNRLFFWLIIAVLLLPLMAFAQDKVGTTAAQFLKIGVGARAVGMGEAYVAVSNDVSSIHYNPGGLVNVMGRTLFGTHINMPADVRYDFLAYSQNLSSIGGVVGISFGALTMDDMERTDIFGGGPTGETFGASSYVMGLTYARSLTDRFSLGGSLKWIQEYLDDESSAEPAADLGIVYRTGFRSLRMGFVIKNFGPDSKFIQESHPLPMNFHFGFAYDLLESYQHKMTLAFDGSHPNDNAERYDIGMEYGFNNMLFLRSGYQFEYDAHSFSFGGGVNLSVGAFTAIVDYAYQDLAELTQAHRLSLTLQY